MNDSIQSHDVPPILDPPPGAPPLEIQFFEPPGFRPARFLSYVVAWTAIVGLMATHMILTMFAAPESRDEATKVDLLQVNLLAKYAVGAKKIADVQVPINVQEFEEGDFPELHWCEAILLNEFDGPRAALEHLEDIRLAIADHHITLTESQTRIADVLTRVFTNRIQGQWGVNDVTAEERNLLTERLGFSGTLALTPKDGPEQDARRQIEDGAVVFAAGLIGALALIAVTLLLGFIGLCIALAALLTKKFQFRFRSDSGQGHIYGETFAVWFALFTAIQLAIGISVPEKYMLLGLGVGFFVSLLALAWPIIRGVPWHQVRRDIGWQAKSNPLVELFYGALAYVTLTPLVLVSFVVMFLLAAFFVPAAWLAQLDPKNGPSHPILLELAKNDPFVIALAIGLACIAAPIVEETMFRGVLYRHLRDSTVWFRRFASVFLSCAINALIFAAIHPQGLLGIPVLGTLAFGFSMVREWRDSLIAPMTMHAINNAIATLLLVLVLGNLG